MANIENSPVKESTSIAISIAPWLSVSNCIKAVEFYKSAFEADEVYRLETADGELMVARLSVKAAEFWVSGEPLENSSPDPDPNTKTSIRMILTVPDPDTVFAQALQAGASEIFPVGEDYGWRLGRLMDPFGHHWEIGHPLTK